MNKLWRLQDAKYPYQQPSKVETLIWHDGPRLVKMVWDECSAVLLNVDGCEEIERWISTELSLGEIKELEANNLSLYDIFSREGSFICDFENGVTEMPVGCYSPIGKIPDVLLPGKNCFLDRSEE